MSVQKEFEEIPGLTIAPTRHSTMLLIMMEMIEH